MKTARLKFVVTDKDETIIAMQDVYDKYTGKLLKKEEKVIRIHEIENQITRLAEELEALQIIREKIIDRQFDKIDDKRNPKKTIVS
jgi:hypothetical protein